jgi:hypothetical protein
MGLIKSVNDITYELQGQKTEKEIKRREKKRLELIKNELYNYFDKQFKKDKNAKYTYAEMLKHKELIIDQLKSYYFNKYNVKLNNDNINYIKQNYFKILNNVKRQYFEIDKIKVQEEKQRLKEEAEAEQQKAKEREEIKNNITKAFKILFAPMWLFVVIVWCALGVNHKKYKRR